MTRPIICMLAAVLLLTSCGLRRVGKQEPEPEERPAKPLFDPLASVADRTVVPEEYPIRPAPTMPPEDSLVPPPEMTYQAYDSAAAETTPTDIYRVQIFTSRLYTEAKRELTIAEEIFNLPLYLDYEVPYYKLRVGDFPTRNDAEDMLSEIKAIGYRNAWVSRVMLQVREAPEYAPEGPILPDFREDRLTRPADSAGQEPGSEDR